MTQLAQFLDKHFKEMCPEAKTDAQRSDFLDIDATSFSRVLRNRLTLTPARAQKWAEKLYPTAPEKQASFAKAALDAAQRRTASVEEFCQSIIDNGGWVPASRISELFDAVLIEGGANQFILAEYRDLPRAGEAAKYEALGEELAKAIASGLNYAMFQPFVGEPNRREHKDAHGLSEADKYMLEMRDKCQEAYRKFFDKAVQYKSKVEKAAPDSDAVDEIKSDIEQRLRLYERNAPAHIGSGIQAKMFLVHYKAAKENHYRIFQWVATPKQDLLIYRGQSEIKPEALRDSFFPVPHYFELFGNLPPLRTDKEIENTESLVRGSSAKILPSDHCAWKSYESKKKPGTKA
ncbi:MAG: hypothetical protein HY243_13060 [Proteobacteria bacterium]|nr:hypothetical protein [Pseudomonadota bacterium]